MRNRFPRSRQVEENGLDILGIAKSVFADIPMFQAHVVETMVLEFDTAGLV
jgi:hypothetical protein